jgi:hypothetical protein
MTPLYSTYSFVDVIATLVDRPTGSNFTIAGPDTATAEEGITVTWGEEMNSQTIGADGSVMNSLHASMAGTVNIRLQKISPVNQQLVQLIRTQRSSSAYWGQTTIAIRDMARGDVYNLAGCAWIRFPVNSYAKIGNVLDYELHVAQIDPNLGTPAIISTPGQGGVTTGFA